MTDLERLIAEHTKGETPQVASILTLAMNEAYELGWESGLDAAAMADRSAL